MTKAYKATFHSKKTQHPDGDKTVVVYVCDKSKKNAIAKAGDELKFWDPDNCSMYKNPKMEDVSHDELNEYLAQKELAGQTNIDDLDLDRVKKAITLHDDYFNCADPNDVSGFITTAMQNIKQCIDAAEQAVSIDCVVEHINELDVLKDLFDVDFVDEFIIKPAIRTDEDNALLKHKQTLLGRSDDIDGLVEVGPNAPDYAKPFDRKIESASFNIDPHRYIKIGLGTYKGHYLSSIEVCLLERDTGVAHTMHGKISSFDDRVFTNRDNAISNSFGMAVTWLMEQKDALDKNMMFDDANKFQKMIERFTKATPKLFDDNMTSGTVLIPQFCTMPASLKNEHKPASNEVKKPEIKPQAAPETKPQTAPEIKPQMAPETKPQAAPETKPLPDDVETKTKADNDDSDLLDALGFDDVKASEPAKEKEISETDRLIGEINYQLSELEPGQTKMIPDLPNAVYHGSHGISSTKIKDACVSLMYYNGVHNTGDIEKSRGTHFDVGNLAHTLTLEPDKTDQEYIKKPETPEPTKPQREKYDKWVKMGKPSKEENSKAYPTELMIERCQFWDDFIAKHGDVIIVDDDNWKMAQSMADAVHNHPDASKILNHPARKSEQSYFKIDDETGLPIKARPDIEIGQIIADMKTIQLRGNPDEQWLLAELRREILRRKYHVSAAMYLDVTGKQQFVWIFVNKEPGYHWVAIIRASQKTLDEGYTVYRNKLNAIGKGYDSGHWPGPVSIEKALNPETEKLEYPEI